MTELLSPSEKTRVAYVLKSGFSALERPLHPVDERTRDGISFLHWPTRGRRGDEFTEEFYAIDSPAAATLPAISAAMPGPDHLVAELNFDQSTDEPAWLAAGYELGSREPIMIASLVESRFEIPVGVAVSRLIRMVDAERVLAAHKSAGYPSRLFTQALLDDPHISLRVVWSDTGEFIAIGKAALLDDAVYITDVMTMPAWRKRGMGRLIMSALHEDAIVAGCTLAVLTSTTIGKSLYESLGYREVGVQSLYATPERD